MSRVVKRLSGEIRPEEQIIRLDEEETREMRIVELRINGFYLRCPLTADGIKRTIKLLEFAERIFETEEASE